MAEYGVRVVIHLRLTHEQKGVYEDGTILRCVKAALPSRADLESLLPAGVHCTMIEVQTEG
jgi:hypothetical protein